VGHPLPVAIRGNRLQRLPWSHSLRSEKLYRPNEAGCQQRGIGAIELYGGGAGFQRTGYIHAEWGFPKDLDRISQVEPQLAAR
jgi:hypothetical protein